MNFGSTIASAALIVTIAGTAPAFGQGGGSEGFTYYLCYTTSGDERQKGHDWGAELQFDPGLMSRNIVILYQHQLGNFPKDGIHVVYSNPDYMEQHLERVRWALGRFVPDPDFDGVAIIDYETWRCVWDRTPVAFKDAWHKHLNANDNYYRNLPSDQKEGYLRHTYELACAEFYLATIEECKALRPNAMWGFYGYPIKMFHNNRETPRGVIGYGDLTHLASQLNDRLQWMWDAVDVVIPSIYAPRYSLLKGEKSTCPEVEASAEDDREFIGSMVAEARRVARGKPVMPIMWLRYHTPRKGCRFYERLNVINLRNQLETPLLSGAAGLIIWGNLYGEDYTKQEQAYFDEVMLPVLRDVVQSNDPGGPFGDDGDSSDGGSGDGGSGDGGGGDAPPSSTINGRGQHRGATGVEASEAIRRGSFTDRYERP